MQFKEYDASMGERFQLPFGVFPSYFTVNGLTLAAGWTVGQSDEIALVASPNQSPGKFS
jgi:hypothetical protein